MKGRACYHLAASGVHRLLFLRENTASTFFVIEQRRSGCRTRFGRGGLLRRLWRSPPVWARIPAGFTAVLLPAYTGITITGGLPVLSVLINLRLRSCKPPARYLYAIPLGHFFWARTFITGSALAAL